MRLQTLLAFSCWLLVFQLATAADDFAGVQLLRPDSLVGWDYGDPRPAGWKISGGQLSGTRGATPLVSGWTFGDFELRLKWQGASGASWKLLLPEVPSGKGLELTWREGEGCGRVQDGDRVLAAGRTLASPKAGSYVAVVRRTAGTLFVEADGQEMAKVQITPDRRFGLGLAILSGQITLTDLRLAEPPGAPMLNGKDLTGWYCPGDIKAWGMEDGALVLRGPNGNYLRTEKLYGNFTLSFTYKVKKGGNSGVGIRTPRDGWPSGDGMELQIWDLPRSQPLNEHSEMAIYGNMPPLARADRSEQWNRVVIKADGWMISAWENGELVQHCNTQHLPELKRRHLQGWIGIQDHNARIEIRDLRVLEAPAGTGLTLWKKPPPACGAAVVLDRLLNSDRLAMADGVRSGTISQKVFGEKKPEYVLAELTGPGALVRIARNHRDGQLSFYFDGEEQPRLQAKGPDLWQAVPQVAEDVNPVLTVLPYRKSLKVVLSGVKKNAEYRLDYVTFPGHMAVESYTRRDSGIPRGWLSPVAYRHGQCWWGVHREHDPLPRYQSPQKAIKPGKSERLVHVDGAGTVLWTKLRANKKVLDNDDLWIEVTVDGEQRPAIAAPARYWFPGLAGQEKFPNFVMTDRDGLTSLLAMPFGEGITISASNRGSKTIHGVGMVISVEPATEANRQAIVHRMRLRGVFVPGGETGASGASSGSSREKPWFSQQGAGRWIGLVYQQTQGKPTPIASLVVDGRPAAGWRRSASDLFLGQNGDFRKCLSGRRGELCWRYLFLEPVEFEKSLTLEGVEQPGARLALFYLAK